MAIQQKSLWNWARWGLVVMTLFTGTALLLTLGSSYQSAQRIAKQVVRAEGYTLINNIRQKLKPNKPVQNLDLQKILKNMQSAGLRYIGVFRLRGKRVASAGQATGHTTFPIRRDALLQDSEAKEGRVRIQTMGFYQKRMNPWQIYRWRTRRIRMGRKPRKNRRFRRRPILFVIEFKPLSAKLVRSEAQWTLMIGGIATLILFAMATFFWFILRRLSTLEVQRQREHQLAALGEMSAVMAHEIRNPLTSLKGHAQLLVEYLPEESKTKAKAERVVHEAERLEQLSSQLLDFVRVETLDVTQVDPVALLKDISETMEPSRFSWDTTSVPHSWNMDETKIRQVFTNLMQNAIQASPPDKNVNIHITGEKQQLKISIRDHGDGISPEQVEKIFTPFFTTRLHGTGLGLAVAQRWVNLHKGTIEVSHPPDGGAEFIVSIPKL